MSQDAQLRLLREQKRQAREKAGLRQGVVTSVAPLKVRIGKADTPVNAVALDGAALTTNDRVSVLVQEQAVVVIGRNTSSPANSVGFVNAQNFGAKGNGTTDDSDAIQAAIDAVAASGGGNLHFPTGIYKITKQITVKRGVDIVGDGGSGPQSGHGTTFKAGHANAQLRFGDGTPGGGNEDGGTSRDFVLEGDGVQNRSDGMLLVDCANNRTFVNVTVCNVLNAGVVCRIGQNCTFISLGIHDVGGTGLRLDDGVGGYLFLRCEVNLCEDYALMITESSGSTQYYDQPTHNTFKHCIFEYNGSPSTINGIMLVTAGDWNVFEDCGFSISDSTTVSGGDSIVQLGVVSPAIYSSVTLRDCLLTVNSAANQKVIRQEAATQVHLFGYNKIGGPSTAEGWRRNGGSIERNGPIGWDSRMLQANRWPQAASLGEDTWARFDAPLRLLVDGNKDGGGLRIQQSDENHPRFDVDHLGAIRFGNGTVAAAQHPWIAVQGGVGFQNGYVNYGDGFSTAAYYRDPLGWVRLKGLLKAPSAGTATAFTLPSGYRPAETMLFNSTSSSLVTRVDVYTDGRVVPTSSATGAWIPIDMICFAAT